MAGRDTEVLLSNAKMAQMLLRQHEKQKRFCSSGKRIRVFFGGNRTGKTVAGAQEVVRYLFGIHEHRKVIAPVEIWCACPSYDLQLDTTQKKLEEIIPRHRIKDITYAKKNVWGRVELDNGSIITFKSYEMGREKFQGAGKRLIWFDEEPPRDIWEECFVRVDASVPLDIIMTMTPVNGMTWVYSELYLNTINPDLEIVTASWEDNPWLTDTEKERMTKGLTSDALVVRKEGKFIQRQGLVCGWFSRGASLVNGMIRDPGWNVYRIVDFGWSSSKTCVLWFGVDSFDRVFLFDGVYVNETDDESLAKIIKEREYGFRVVRGWADNQPDRINTLKRNGVYCEPVQKTSGGGNWDTFRAEAMYKLGAINPATGRPTFFVSSGLTIYDPDTNTEMNWFVREIESLRWKEKRGDAGFVSSPEWNKDGAPIKGSHFDAMDAFSYFAVMFNRRSIAYSESLGRYIDEEDKPKQKRVIINPLTGF